MGSLTGTVVNAPNSFHTSTQMQIAMLDAFHGNLLPQ